MAISPVHQGNIEPHNPIESSSTLLTIATRVGCVALSALASGGCFFLLPPIIGIPAAIVTFISGLRMGGLIGSPDTSWMPSADWIPEFPDIPESPAIPYRSYHRIPQPSYRDEPVHFDGDRHRVGEDDVFDPILHRGGGRHRVGEDDMPEHLPTRANGGFFNFFGFGGGATPHERHRVGTDDTPTPALRGGGGRHRVGVDDTPEHLPTRGNGGFFNFFGLGGRATPHERHRVGIDDTPTPALHGGGGRHRVGVDDI